MKKIFHLAMFLLVMQAVSGQDYILKNLQSKFSISQSGQGINIIGNDIQDNLGNFFVKGNAAAFLKATDTIGHPLGTNLYFLSPGTGFTSGSLTYNGGSARTWNIDTNKFVTNWQLTRGANTLYGLNAFTGTTYFGKNYQFSFYGNNLNISGSSYLADDNSGAIQFGGGGNAWQNYLENSGNLIWWMHATGHDTRIDFQNVAGGGILIDGVSVAKAGSDNSHVILGDGSYAPISGLIGSSGNSYIQNQYTSSQSANFWLNGRGKIDSGLTVSGINIGLGHNNLSGNTVVGNQGLSANTTGISNSLLGYQALFSNTSGSYNAVLGYQAMKTNTSGEQNVAIGYQSLYSNTTGNYNVAIGMAPMQANTSGFFNVGIGYGDLGSNTTGYGNTAINSSLGLNTTGSNNVAIGGAMGANTTGTYNTAMGKGALARSIDGGYNTAIGTNAGAGNTHGSQNVAIGNTALNVSTTASFSTAVGAGALGGQTTGSNNVGLGYSAGVYTTAYADVNRTGNNSVFLGYGTMAQADAQTNQIVIGYNATGLGSNTTVIGNSATTTAKIFGSAIYNGLGQKLLTEADTVGHGALGAASQIDTNKFVTNWQLTRGANTLYGLNAFSGPTSFCKYGEFAFDHNSFYISGANYLSDDHSGGIQFFGNGNGWQNYLDNTGNLTWWMHASGHNASVIFQNIDGGGILIDGVSVAKACSDNSHVILGDGTYAPISGLSGSSGSSYIQNQYTSAQSASFWLNGRGKIDSGLTVSGINIGLGHNNLSSNTVVGYQGLSANTNGSTNSLLGYQALFSNTSGSSNAVLGYQAMKTNSSGAQNVAVGYQSLFSNTTGNWNVAIGMQPMYSNTSGFFNVAIGYEDLGSNTTGYGNTAINSSLGLNTTGSNNVAIGGAMGKNTTGTYNTAIGKGALVNSIDGGYNTGIGAGAGAGNTHGNQNVAIGSSALNASTTASYSTAVGADALSYQTTGSNNVGLGFGAGTNTSIYAGANRTGNNSVFIGYGTMAQDDAQTNQIVIGYNSTGLGNNTTVIGNSATTTAKIYGSAIFNGLGQKLLTEADTLNRVLLPRMTTTQKNAISSPAEGLMVYDLTLHGISYYNGTAWKTAVTADVNGNMVTSNKITTADGKEIFKTPNGSWKYVHVDDDGSRLVDSATVSVDSYGNATVTIP